jgi:hypothetical protein
MTSPMVTLLLSVGIYSFFVIIQFGIYIIIFLSFNRDYSIFHCQINLNQYFEFIIAFLYCVIFLISIIDTLLNLKTFLFKPKTFWIKSDPFRIRIQQLFIFFILISYSISFVNYILVPLRVQLYNSSGQMEKLIIYAIDLIYFATATIMKYCLTLFEFSYFCLFVLILTIGQRAKNSFFPTKVVKMGFLEEFLNHEILYNSFSNFCENEWSVENLLCYNDIKIYPNLKMNERHSHVQRMIKLYFNGTLSELEVNLSSRLCAALIEDVKVNNFSDDLFGEISKTVQLNLSDTYSRFIVSKEYLSIIKTIELVEDQNK